MIVKVLILTLVICALYFDFRSYKIPNLLSAYGMIWGLVISMYSRGVKGVYMSVSGIVIPFITLFMLYAIRALGAGDIKLICAIGSYIGKDIIKVMEYTFFAAWVIAVAVFICKKIRKKRGMTRMHFSLPIGIGVILYFLCGG